MIYHYVCGARCSKVIDDTFENQVYLVKEGSEKIKYLPDTMDKVKVLHYRYLPITLDSFYIKSLRKMTTDHSSCVRFCSFSLYSMLRNHTYNIKVFPPGIPQYWGQDTQNMYVYYIGWLMTV